MVGAELIAFESFADLFGQQLRFEELCESLSGFSRNSVLWVCSYIGVSLQLWNRNSDDSPNVEYLINVFFEPRLAQRLLLRRQFLSEGKRVVFHRRQLLFLAKLALSHCTDQGVNAAVQSRSFGLLFLHANDHFHFDLLPTMAKGEFSRKDLAKAMVELLAAEEYSHAEIPNIFVRSRMMCLTLPERLRGHSDYLNIEDLFRKKHHFEIRLFQQLAFGISSRFGENTAAKLRAEPYLLPIRHSDFATTQVDPKDIQYFFDLVSSTPPSLSRHASLLRRDEGFRSRWASDATVFRQKPLMLQWFEVGTYSTYVGFLLMDHYFLLQKVLSEPYFLGIGVAPKGFARFWGAIFEEYIHDFMKQSTNHEVNCYVRNPRIVGVSNKELCDAAVICGDSLLLLEYKSAIIRADHKYNGDPVALTKEISEKFVYDTKDNNPKAVTQLSTAVKTLFGGDVQASVDWCDLSKIKRCYVLIVTLDTIGGALGMSSLLNTYFKEQLTVETFEHVQVRPIFCTDVETLEMVSGCLKTTSFASILERWYQANNLLSMPLASVRMDDLIPTRPAWLWEDWALFSEEATQGIFNKALLN